MDSIQNLNYILDGIVAVVLIAAILIGAGRGFIKSVLKTFSSVLSLGISYALHPIITRGINATPIFDVLKSGIAGQLGLSLDPTQTTKAEQINMITDLNLPDFVTERLIENNNSVVYDLLDVHGIADYICGYIANMIIGIIVIVILTFVVKLILRAIYRTSDLISKLPIVHQLNYLGGAVLGLVSGLIVVWIVLMVSMIFVTSDSYTVMLDAINNSVLCKLLYDNNVIANILMGDLF